MKNRKLLMGVAEQFVSSAMETAKNLTLEEAIEMTRGVFEKMNPEPEALFLVRVENGRMRMRPIEDESALQAYDVAATKLTDTLTPERLMELLDCPPYPELCLRVSKLRQVLELM